MASVIDVLSHTKTITFDCYGTLIDWRAGLSESFRKLFGPAVEDRMDELFEAYGQIEAEVEAESYQPYRTVLTTVAERLGQRFGFGLPPGQAGILAELLPEWKPFEDTNGALARLKRGYRLGVLSNIDRDLFECTARHFDVPFDFVITAEDVRAYKPEHAHFERLLSVHSERDEVLHVAQSLFHDGAPAAQLGIAYVWINRYDDPNKTSVTPLAEYPGLKALADAACEKQNGNAETLKH